MAMIDERKIEEIVAKVLERLQGGVSKAPPHGVQPAAAAAGPSKKEAEQEAARLALEKLKTGNDV